MKKVVDRFGIPFIIVSIFFLLLTVVAAVQGQNMGMLFSDILNRWGMNGILVLAMVPAIQSGIGLNFGLSIGIVSGLLGTLITMEMHINKWEMFAQSPAGGMLTVLLVSIILATIIGIVMGLLYGIFLNMVKKYEMTVSTYVGFAVVAIMNIGWLKLPFRNPEAVWAVGGSGLRNTVSLESAFAGVLNNFGMIKIGELHIPTGLLLVFALACFCMWVFLRSKTGIAMSAAGLNERYAITSGINPNRMRILGTVLSTVLGGIGIIISSQSFGFLQLYNAPQRSSFPIAASILIGGATVFRAKISHVVVGTLLFHGVMVVSMPVLNTLLPGMDISEILRIIISNGIILYALTKAGGGTARE